MSRIKDPLHALGAHREHPPHASALRKLHDDLSTSLVFARYDESALLMGSDLLAVSASNAISRRTRR